MRAAEITAVLQYLGVRRMCVDQSLGQPGLLQERYRSVELPIGPLRVAPGGGSSPQPLVSLGLGGLLTQP